jgi:hypothetical protein
MEYYSAIKSNKLLVHTTMGERRSDINNMYYMIIIVGSSKIGQMNLQ